MPVGIKKILIVDDLEPFVRQEKSILDRSNFEVFTATSGKEALQIHRREKVDLLLADLNMPGMDGDELVRVIRGEPALRKVSVIMVCTQKKSEIERCASCGANEYITKPIDPRKLYERVSRLLSIPQRRSLRVLIKVTVQGAFGSDPFFGTTHNISTSGLLLETDKVLARGDRVNCLFFIPDSERIKVEGEVVRVLKGEKNYQYGVSFGTLEEKNRKIIEEYVGRKG